MANPANSAQALATLQATQKQAQDPNTILANQNQQLGVNSARDTVTGLRGAINNTTKLLQQVAPSVMGRTANSLVTNAQASRQVANEQAPIQTNLTQEGTDYNQAGEDLTRLQGEAQTAASGIYQGQQDKLSYAQNLYNTLYQKESDAVTRKAAAAAAAESKREFDAQLAASKRAAAAGRGSFDLSGGSGSVSGKAPVNSIKSQATSFIQSLAKQNNASVWLSNLTGIIKSAGYGNKLDQAKLEVAKALEPGLFTSKGKLNTARLNYLKSQGL